MRNEAYDKMAREALARIKELPTEEVNAEVDKINEALLVVLAETDEKKLQAYYKNIEEFYTVNADKGLEYLNGEYLLTNGVE